MNDSYREVNNYLELGGTNFQLVICDRTYRIYKKFHSKETFVGYSLSAVNRR